MKEDGDDKCKHDVSVIVRVRGGGSTGFVRCESPAVNGLAFTEVIVGDGEKNRFTFDSVFPPTCSQEDVFNSIGANVVKNALEGYNACVMTYGQTSSGKTFSMIGPEGGNEQLFLDGSVSIQTSELGLVPRILDALFQKQGNSTGELTMQIELNCVELYNEVFFDLLSSVDRNVALRIREDAVKGIFVDGASSVVVSSTPQLFEQLRRVALAKHTSFTAMNATSSRSHTIMIAAVSQVDHVRHDSTTNSRIFLVDLAGSERVEKTGAVGDRLKEAQNINLSLTLLGNVIKKLTDGNSMHIPYRDSKLTRLLQNSLGGNSVTTLLCTVSPDASNASETLSTLGFAQRAKCIKNRPSINKVLAREEYAKEIASLRLEVSELHERLRDLAGISRLRAVNSSDPEDLCASLESALRELHEVKKELRESQVNESQLNEVVLFHQQRERELQDTLKGIQETLENERACTQAAFQKLDDLATPKLDCSKTRFVAPTIQRQHSSISKDDRRHQNASVSERIEPVPLPTAEAPLGPRLIVEAQAVVRERMLLTQVSALQEELASSRKFSTMCEHLMRELDAVKLSAERSIQARDEKTASLLKEAESRIQELTNQLQEESNSRASITLTTRELEHLRMENVELHNENRANACRLLDFTKRIDSLTKDVNELKDDRSKLIAALESSNIEAKLKQQLLSMAQLKGAKDRSYFRKKLLECFSTD